MTKCEYERCYIEMGDSNCGKEDNGKQPPLNFFLHEGKWYCSDHMVKVIEDNVKLTAQKRW